MSAKKRDIHPAGKTVWGYRKIYHHFFCRDVQPVLCNSFQKSGTHLLVGIIESLPQFHHYGRKAYWHYLTRARVDPKKVSQPSQVINKLSRCLQGEIFRGHIAANQELLEFFSQNRVKHLFIYRDLRDVVVSHFFGMKKRKAIETWPSRYFYALPSDEERLDFLIDGWPKNPSLEELPVEVDYPNIGERFRENLPWLEDPHCLAIRFEDLVNPAERSKTHLRIARHLFSNANEEQIREAAGKIPEGHNPKNSKTFRKGTSGEWKTHFTKRQKELFKEVAGQTLIDLGYEKDFDW